MSAANIKQPAQPVAETNAELSETDRKLELIDYSYKEVLDATKHQDDKIGQLLTSISFLTAATLALAALESGDFITRPFVVDPFKLPLALIALVVFLLGVAWSVMLLLASLSTPLRIPGITQSRRDKPMDWVKGVRASQIYFYEISRISVAQWEDKWSDTVDALKLERLRSLIRETHNLSVRTRAKYDRTTEAVALLSVALLAFALSIVFVAIVAGTPDSQHAVTLTWWQRLVIGWVFGCYAWLQTLARIRYGRQAVDEAPPMDEKSGDRNKSVAEIWYAVTLGLLLIDAIAYDSRQPGLAIWIATTILLTIIFLVAFVFTSSRHPRMLHEILPAVWAVLTEPRTSLRKKWFRHYWGRWLLVIVTVGLTVAVIWCGVDGLYAGQLGAASFAVLLIIGSAIVQPTFAAFKQRKEYWENVKATAATPAAAPSSVDQPGPVEI